MLGDGRLGDGRVEVLPLDESYVYAFVLHHGGKRFLIANVLFINSLLINSYISE